MISNVVGAVEKVPYARNCAVPSKFRSVTELGKTVIESRGSAAAVVVTVTVAVAVTTLASVFVHLAVMSVVPALTPEAWPGFALPKDSIVAMD